MFNRKDKDMLDEMKEELSSDIRLKEILEELERTREKLIKEEDNE